MAMDSDAVATANCIAVRLGERFAQSMLECGLRQVSSCGRFEISNNPEAYKRSVGLVRYYLLGVSDVVGGMASAEDQKFRDDLVAESESIEKMLTEVQCDFCDCEMVPDKTWTTVQCQNESCKTTLDVCETCRREQPGKGIYCPTTHDLTFCGQQRMAAASQTTVATSG